MTSVWPYADNTRRRALRMCAYPVSSNSQAKKKAGIAREPTDSHRFPQYYPTVSIRKFLFLFAPDFFVKKYCHYHGTFSSASLPPFPYDVNCARNVKDKDRETGFCFRAFYYFLSESILRSTTTFWGDDSQDFCDKAALVKVGPANCKCNEKA